MFLSKWRLLSISLLLVLGATLSYGEITATPSTLTFHNTNQEETVTLTADGTEIPATAVHRWQFLVDQRNYSHMLQVKHSATGLCIQPSNTAEAGSYQLVLDTASGNVAISVFMPLSELKTSIESLSKRMNIPIEEIQQQMGFTRRLGREKITMNLLPVYYLGQRILITMPGIENRISKWNINGETIQEGPEAQNLEYSATATGPLLVTYEEWEDNALVASATTLTEVVREPAILQEVGENVTVAFQAPPGFASYTWMLDEVQTGTNADFSHQFKTPGEYQVTVKCAEPTTSSPYTFREVQYKVCVLPD